MSVYERIKSVKRGMKWNYISEQIGGDYHGRMTDLKNGKTTLSNSQLEKAAEILGTTLDYLLGKTDDPYPGEQKEKLPAPGGEQIQGYDQLTPENKILAQKYIDFLIAGQQNP